MTAYLIFYQRRAGIRDGGAGQYVNLPMAWTELAQLAQCRGKIQEGNFTPYPYGKCPKISNTFFSILFA